MVRLQVFLITSLIKDSGAILDMILTELFIVTGYLEVIQEQLLHVAKNWVKNPWDEPCRKEKKKSQITI